MTLEEFVEGLVCLKTYYRVGPTKSEFDAIFYDWAVYRWRWWWPFWVKMKLCKTKKEANVWLADWLEGLTVYE